MHSNHFLPIHLGKFGNALLILLLLWIFFATGMFVFAHWSIWRTATGLWIACVAAAGGAVLLGPPMLRRMQGAVDRGLDTLTALRPGRRPLWRDRLACCAAAGMLCFMLTTGVLCALALASWPALSERSYQATVTTTCTGIKCSGCTRRADILLRFDDTDSTICVDAIQPALRGGERIIVRGYFHPLMIRIDSVRRAPPASPISRP